MPSFDASKPQSATSRQTSPGLSEADLQAAVQRIAGHIVDANRRHCQALDDMQERLGQIGRHVDQTRAIVSSEHADAVGRLEDEIADLVRRINNLGQERQSPREAGPALHADADNPWDAQSAEALARACETAQAEASVERRHDRAPPIRKTAADIPVRSAPASDVDRMWLETRFAAIAGQLQQSLAERSPIEPIAVLGRRLDQMETRLESLLGDMPARLSGDWLRIVEGHIRDLSAQLEATSRQFARLDAVDENLRQLSRGLEEQRQAPQAPAAELPSDAVETLIHSAAERAAQQIAATMTAPDASGEQRMQALEVLMQDYITESRRGEESTSGILRTIEEALARIVERIDAMEAPTLEARARELAGVGDDGLDAEGRRLAEAYAAGARVLGNRPLVPTLDATDYAPSAPTHASSTAERISVVAGDAAVAPATPSSQELRASALRGKLKAQAAREAAEPMLPMPSPLDPEIEQPAAVKRSDPKPMLRTGTRTRALMGGTLALLFAGGYLVVDRLVTAAPSASTPQELAADPATASVPSGTAGVLAEPRPEAPAGRPGASQPSGESDRQKQLEPAARTATPPAQPAALTMQPAADEGVGLSGIAMLPPEIGSAALRSAAASGDALAQFEVASRYADGTGVTADHKLAFAWYERSAARGLAAAQFRLGAYYERGLGIAADPERAKIWYRRAADQGHVRSMHNLAVLMVGKDAERSDYASAVHWFQAAAARGYVDSQFNLATLYAFGRGVAKDLSESYKWFALAARAGDAGAARRLDEIKAQMEPAELEAAEIKATAWRKIEPIASAASR